MRLEPLLKQESTLVLSGLADRDAVLTALAEHAHGRLTDVPTPVLLEALLDRERSYPTSTPEAVAFPHAILKEIDETVLVAAKLDPAVDFGAGGGHPPVALVFAMFGSAAKPFQHVQLLARLARICRWRGALEQIGRASDADDLRERLIAEDRAHA